MENLQTATFPEQALPLFMDGSGDDIHSLDHSNVDARLGCPHNDIIYELTLPFLSPSLPQKGSGRSMLVVFEG